MAAFILCFGMVRVAVAQSDVRREVADKAMEGFSLFVRDSLPDDRARGYDMMLEAAWEGDAKAANNVGWLMLQGDYVAKDEKGALRWFERSADQGLPAGALNYMDLLMSRPDLALRNLPVPDVLARASALVANAMLMGRGLPHDYRRGEEFLLMAALFGDERSAVTVAQQLEMYPDALSESELRDILSRCDALLPEERRYVGPNTDISRLLEDMMGAGFWYSLSVATDPSQAPDHR